MKQKRSRRIKGLVNCVWKNDWFFRNPGHIQVLKRHNNESFHLWNYFLVEFVSKQTIHSIYYVSVGLGLSDNIDQVQCRTKLRNFGCAATRTNEVNPVKNLALEST
jgi:hypothetical protein